MHHPSRRSIVKLALCGLTALSLPLLTLHAAGAETPPPNPKGSYTGTFQSGSGHGSGNFSLKVSSVKPGSGNSWQIKGTVKIGRTAYKMLLGSVVNSPQGPVLAGPIVNGKATVLGGIELELSPTGNTFGGSYTLATRQNQPIDNGTLSGTKGR